MLDPTQIVQGILFSIFAVLTAALSAVIGPLYDNLLVPEMSASALYPTLPPVAGAGSSFLGTAAGFSDYLLANLVDPAVALVAFGIAFLYLGRSVLGRWTVRFESAVPQLVLCVILANFTVIVAGGILGVAGSAFPVVADFDHGAWQRWANLAGVGSFQFAWDNGVVAFVLSFAIFSIVLLLVVAVALRDALLGVLLVLLPVFTILGPIPVLSTLARRAWLLFAELAFLPCVLVVPLELAVGAPSILLLLGYLIVALSSPALLSVAGTQLSSFGFPAAGGAVTGGIQRGLSVGSLSLSSIFRPMLSAGGGSRVAAAAARIGKTAGAAAFPAAAPLLAAELVGHGSARLVRHLGSRSFRPAPLPYRHPTVMRYSDFHP